MKAGTRRNFLRQTGAVASGLLLPSVAGFAQVNKQTDSKRKQTLKEKVEELEVTPNEDLMREHGLLRRVCLIYDESANRLMQPTAGKPDFDPSLVIQSADIVRKFVEDYHEVLEQEHVFPRLQRAGQLTGLVKTLLDQHRLGRILTDKIKHSASTALRNKDDARTLADAIHKFQYMYRPHAAWEDTVLFPAFKQTLSQHEYDALGEDFEKVETQKFGEEGFEHVLEQVAAIEKKLGISDPSYYTPTV
jgi:hemerythrin-like domain-containing protein